jgi:tetratricopeptide (TPR) repeat protein
VIDLLKRYAHIDDADDAHTIRAKVTGQVLTLDETLQDALPALLALFDALPDDSPFRQLDPAQRRQRTLTALKRVLLRESQVQPLLLVFEDLHWIDTETQVLLDSLVESLPTAHILLLVNYRPEYQHDWGSKTYYTQLRLDPLPQTSAAAILQALLGDDPSLAPLTPLLIARTAGNPFFLEESVRTLVETGGLVGEPGAYRLAQPLQSIQVPATVQGIQVPATVQAVLAARIDRLPSEAKRLLQTAAVIGTEVSCSLLNAIADLSDTELHRHLAHLQAAEFLYETRLFPELEYTFKHALTHEVAYGSLLQERRRALHARIVEALEALAGDRMAEVASGRSPDQVGSLAHHALRGEVWDKALAYCRQAGEKAMTQMAYREALEYFEQAINVLPHLSETRDTREQAIDLRLAMGSALLPSANFECLVACLHEAESLAMALDDPLRLAQVSSHLLRYFYQRGAHDQVIATAQHALTLAIASGDVVLPALVHYYLGFVYQTQGDYRRAIDCFGQTVASFDGTRRRENFGPLLPAVLSYAYLACCHADLGRFAEGIALGEEGLRIAEAVAHPASLMYACWGIGLLALRQGDLRRALPLLERAVSICQEVDLALFFPRMAAALGAAYTLAGRIADAVSLLKQGMEQATTMERVDLQALCSLPLVEAHLLAARLEEAHVLAKRTLRQERGHQTYALRLLGEIATRRDPPQVEQAEVHYRQALALAEELGMRPLQAHCHLGLGTLYAQTGRPEPARAVLTTAIAMYRDMDMTFWLPQAEAALAQLS